MKATLENTKSIGKLINPFFAIICLATVMAIVTTPVLAVTRVSVASGSYNQPGSWNPAGIPGPGDQVTIQNNHIIDVDGTCMSGKLTIANGGKLTFSPSGKITINSDFIVFGIAEIIEGNLELSTPGAVRV